MKGIIWALIGGLVGVLFTLQFQAISRNAEEKSSEECSIKWKQNHFKLSEKNLIDELQAQGCVNVESAYNDAMAGSDSLRSSSCVDMNNVFGMCDKEGKYIRYQHWTESVADYIRHN